MSSVVIVTSKVVDMVSMMINVVVMVTMNNMMDWEISTEA